MATPPLHDVHTVIFDLDGTLSDSGLLTISAMELLAEEFNLPHPTTDAIKRATGFATPEFYYILFPNHPQELIFKYGKAIDQKEKQIMSNLSDRLLFDGCKELLEELKKRNISIKLASTGDSLHVHTVLEATGIKEYFKSISCHRPDKIEMLREIINDGNKSGFVMVGDMTKDSDAARANGILSVGACYGYCLKEIANFDYYIDSPLELLTLMDTDVSAHSQH